MSILDRLRGGGDDAADEEGDDGGEGGEDALFDEGGDDFGDLGDEGDLGGEDLGGGDGGGSDELQQRVEELEKELESVSSTTSTIKSENEAINETVEDVEENVRKLLEIYEMVTKGVNPFVDDVQEGGTPDSDAFGVFGDGDGGEGEEIDDDIADAEAEEFFEDDLDDEPEEDVEDDAFDLEGDDAGEDGQSFEDLKEEYDSGDADWAEGEGDDVMDEEFDMEDDGGETGGESEEPDGDLQFAEDTMAPGTEDAKPYLRTVPDGYVADLLVMEWMEYLQGEADRADAVRAIRYYEAIGWLAEPAAEQLRAVLDGFDPGNGQPQGQVPAELSIDHHVRSLEYIGQLAGSAPGQVALGKVANGGAGDGLQG